MATWRETFAAHYALLFGAGEEPALSAAVNAWLDSRQALGWALAADASEVTRHAGGAPGEFAHAASEAVALAARQLARHHDHTLLYQLGFTAAQVRKIRLWARGTEHDLRGAADIAYSHGRLLHIADIPGPAAVSDLPPMLGHGVTVPAQGS